MLADSPGPARGTAALSECCLYRVFKDRLYGQFARIGKAVASPHRLELQELLAQGERTVESLATEIGVSMANASQHLQSLRYTEAAR